LSSLSERERAIRLPLKDDLEHYAARGLKIRTKAGKIEPLLFERIRDKIAASKKKGMWMGGVPPLGYRVQDRKLVIIAFDRDAPAKGRIGKTTARISIR
jgi:hypothetical protein